jgi:DNA-binding MarR family transcriptional regulator
VRTLLHKGLLAKSKDQPRGKAEILEVTTSGRALLKLDPSREIESILSGLSDEARVLLSDTLELLIRRLSLPLAKIA